MEFGYSGVCCTYRFVDLFLVDWKRGEGGEIDER